MLWQCLAESVCYLLKFRNKASKQDEAEQDAENVVDEMQPSQEIAPSDDVLIEEVKGKKKKEKPAKIKKEKVKKNKFKEQVQDELVIEEFEQPAEEFSAQEVLAAKLPAEEIKQEVLAPKEAPKPKEMEEIKPKEKKLPPKLVVPQKPVANVKPAQPKPVLPKKQLPPKIEQPKEIVKPVLLTKADVVEQKSVKTMPLDDIKRIGEIIQSYKDYPLSPLNSKAVDGQLKYYGLEPIDYDNLIYKNLKEKEKNEELIIISNICNPLKRDGFYDSANKVFKYVAAMYGKNTSLMENWGRLFVANKQILDAEKLFNKGQCLNDMKKVKDAQENVEIYNAYVKECGGNPDAQLTTWLE